MCQEVFQIAMSMDLKSVEMQLALQCAPLITGARISNMLMIDSTDESVHESDSEGFRDIAFQARSKE